MANVFYEAIKHTYFVVWMNVTGRLKTIRNIQWIRQGIHKLYVAAAGNTIVYCFNLSGAEEAVFKTIGTEIESSLRLIIKP